MGHGRAASPGRRSPRPRYGVEHQATAGAFGRTIWPCMDGVQDYRSNDEPIHPSTDLVADHLVPGDASLGHRVVCRRHNQQAAQEGGCGGEGG